MSGRCVSHQSISSGDADKPSLPHLSQHLPHELQFFICLEYMTPLDNNDIRILRSMDVSAGLGAD